ncbi:MAG: hypothetical protein EXS24_00805 [Pedosphaera sp.]|nr:hypothetical protein [Pedosphaera sp.]
MSLFKSALFQQGAWISAASFAGGMACYLVHLFAQRLGPEQYGVFTAGIRLVEMISWPALGLQTVMAQRAAAVRTGVDEGSFFALRNGLLKRVFFLWAVLVLAAVLGAQPICDHLRISSAVGAWVLVASLGAVLVPVLGGELQGRQFFGALGAIFLLNGVTRLLVAAVGIVYFSQSAPAGMVGVAAGFLAAAAVAWFALPRAAKLISADVDWKGWFKDLLPLSVGAGAGVFLFGMDMIVVKRHLTEKDAGLYAAASTVGRVLPLLLGPLIGVMFPKIVRAGSRAEAGAILRQTLLMTGAGCVLMVGGLWLWPELPLRLARFKPEYLSIAPLIPKLALAMVPLVLAGALVNCLLALRDYRIVPWLGVLCVAAFFMMDYVCQKLAARSPVEFDWVAAQLGAVNLFYLGLAMFFWNLPQRGAVAGRAGVDTAKFPAGGTA